MAKIADKYLKVEPWAIVEEGFDVARNRVSESIFSLGNEYMGVRGYPDEGYNGDSLLGSYFNGLYEEVPVGAHYRGIIRSLRFMVNAVDWLYTRIKSEGEILNLARSHISGFTRRLDFKTGVYTRQFDWHLQSGKTIHLCFERIVSMTRSNLGAQRISFWSKDYEGPVEIQSGLDFSPLHEDQGRNFWEMIRKGEETGWMCATGKTVSTGNRLFSSFQIQLPDKAECRKEESNKYTGINFKLMLEPGKPSEIEKIVVNVAEKNREVSDNELWQNGVALAHSFSNRTFNDILAEQEAYWSKVWQASDITIEGDLENQQGIRFCIFQLYQTYRGDNPGFNIGAKGLTGEAYRGLAFWDTETYCLPFYLFNNPKAARSLLEFRYRSLQHALERAKDVDCEGAFYPIATIDGSESCDLWQHSNLQLQVGTAVGYGIWHYVKLAGDKSFLYKEGMEILIQLCRFNESRGQWGQQTGQFGYFGVMGPDEFQLMVNNNSYLNFMAKKLFEYTVQVAKEMEQQAPEKLADLMAMLNVSKEEFTQWERLASCMRIPLDEKTGIYEQHDGFFNMPHIDVDAIPVEQFPLYHHWSYDRLYRYDMVKQPDVLMFMFLYSSDFPVDAKRVNYEYYEPRCIHESSLSPSIHSIFAAELGKHEEAYRFFEFATRLDLDNYNRNTREGLHTTSIAAAWMNIVYGFGGLRSDGDTLLLQPSIPAHWDGYSFNFQHHNTVVSVKVDQEQLTVTTASGDPVELRIYDQTFTVDSEGVRLSLPASSRNVTDAHMQA